MSFGLTNGTTTFMELMSYVFQPYLDSFVIVFINDNLCFFSNNEADNVRHLWNILQRLRKEKFCAKFSKCKFYLESMTF